MIHHPSHRGKPNFMTGDRHPPTLEWHLSRVAKKHRPQKKTNTFMFCGLIHWNVPRISTLLDNTVGTARNHHGGQVATLFAVWLPFHVYLGEQSKTFSVCFYYVKLSIDSVLFPDGTYQFVHVHGLHGQNGHYTFLTFDGSQLFDGFSPEIIAVTPCGDAIFFGNHQPNECDWKPC